jgi:hypothetical protein
LPRSSSLVIVRSSIRPASWADHGSMRSPSLGVEPDRTRPEPRTAAGEISRGRPS